MKNLLKKVLMLFCIFCLTNTVFAQSEYDFEDDSEDDFFEFVVVEEPEPEEEETGALPAEEVVAEEESTEVVSSAEEDTSEPVTDDAALLSSEQVDETQEAQTQETASVQETVISDISEGEATQAASLGPAVSDISAVSAVPAVSTPAVEEIADSTVNAVGSNNAETPANTETEGTMPEQNSGTNSTVTNETDEAEQTEIEEETPADEKAPSRSVTIKKKQYLDVTYPGEGWLYMGDENNSKALSFKGREQKGNTTLLKFYADRSGEALLHFCKQDILMDTYIHDYLLVIVEKTSGNKQHISAPEYIPPAAASAENEEETDISLNIENETEITEEEISEEQEEPVEEEVIISSGISLADEPDVIFSFGDGIDFFGDSSDDDYYQQLIDEANDAFFAGRGQEAVDKAQIVIDDGSYFSDEAYYIQAQVYETNQDMLDVNKAYELYKTIVDYYPESSYWSKASKRVTYLDRYYFQIR